MKIPEAHNHSNWQRFTTVYVYSAMGQYILCHINMTSRPLPKAFLFLLSNKHFTVMFEW